MGSFRDDLRRRFARPEPRAENPVAVPAPVGTLPEPLAPAAPPVAPAKAPEPPAQKPSRATAKQRSDFKGERKRVQLRLPVALVDALDRLAGSQNTDRNALIESVLAAAIVNGPAE